MSVLFAFHTQKKNYIQNLHTDLDGKYTKTDTRKGFYLTGRSYFALICLKMSFSLKIRFNLWRWTSFSPEPVSARQPFWPVNHSLCIVETGLFDALLCNAPVIILCFNKTGARCPAAYLMPLSLISPLFPGLRAISVKLKHGGHMTWEMIPFIWLKLAEEPGSCWAKLERLFLLIKGEKKVFLCSLLQGTPTHGCLIDKLCLPLLLHWQRLVLKGLAQRHWSFLSKVKVNHRLPTHWFSLLIRTFEPDDLNMPACFYLYAVIFTPTLGCLSGAPSKTVINWKWKKQTQNWEKVRLTSLLSLALMCKDILKNKLIDWTFKYIKHTLFHTKF